LKVEINYSQLPDYMQESVREYIENGKPVGHFLTAVFSNDLAGAVTRADSTNLAALRDYVLFLYNEPVPRECKGSKEKVDAWMKAGGLQGQAASTEEALERGYF
jgi:hypothetical protein